MPLATRWHVGGRLSAHQPAIDRDHRSGHVVGQIGREELDDFGAILDRPEPPQGTSWARSRLLRLLPGMTLAMIRPVPIPCVGLCPNADMVRGA